MESYQNGKWAKKILSQQQEDGLWGNFHTLSCPIPGKHYTTEQAIRKLYHLGYTKEAPEIQTVLRRMEEAILGEQEIDSYSEKTHDWPFFEQLMLAAWIRIFDPENNTALSVAKDWAKIVEDSFSSASYCQADDIAAFTLWKGRKPQSGFETGFGMFYHAALLPGVLSPETENRFLDYYLTRPQGMYYIYEKPLNRLPDIFSSKESVRYLTAIEVLSHYSQAKDKLVFVADWLTDNVNEPGRWDFGKNGKDGVVFPLSDRWDDSGRIKDSTSWILRLMKKLK